MNPDPIIEHALRCHTVVFDTAGWAFVACKQPAAITVGPASVDIS